MNPERNSENPIDFEKLMKIKKRVEKHELGGIEDEPEIKDENDPSITLSEEEKDLLDRTNKGEFKNRRHGRGLISGSNERSDHSDFGVSEFSIHKKEEKNKPEDKTNPSDPEREGGYTIDKSRKILERAFAEKVTEEYNAPHEFRRRKKRSNEELDQKPGYQKTNKELLDVFTPKELNNIRAIKLSTEAGDVGGEIDDISLEERIKSLEEKMGRKFSKLEAIKWQVEHGQLGDVEGAGELEKIPSGKELRKIQRTGEEVLDDKDYTGPDFSGGEARFDKVYWSTSVDRKKVIDEIGGWKEKYGSLTETDKKFFIQGLRKMASDRGIAEEIVNEIEKDPSARSLYELYGYFNQTKFGIFTSRFGEILLKPEIISDPEKFGTRRRLWEMIAKEGQPESIRIFFQLIKDVKECPYEDVSETNIGRAIELRRSEQQRILSAVGILEKSINENKMLDEDELEEAQEDIVKLRDEINNNIEEFEMDYQQWKKTHPEHHSSK